MLGKVKWYDIPRGFGFITGENGSDVFFNRTAVEGSGFFVLRKGQEVEFELSDKGKGNQVAAIHVLS